MKGKRQKLFGGLGCCGAMVLGSVALLLQELGLVGLSQWLAPLAGAIGMWSLVLFIIGRAKD